MANQQRRVCILRLGALYGRNGSSSSALPAWPAAPTRPRRALHQLGPPRRCSRCSHRGTRWPLAGSGERGGRCSGALAELLNATWPRPARSDHMATSQRSGTPGLNRRISNRLLKQRGFELSHPRIALLMGMAHPSANQHPHQSQHHHNGDDDIGDEHGTGCRLTHLENLSQEPRRSHHPEGDQDDGGEPLTGGCFPQRLAKAPFIGLMAMR